jgi:hypothetical protein
LSEVLVEWPEDFCDKSGRFQEKTDNQKSWEISIVKHFILSSNPGRMPKNLIFLEKNPKQKIQILISKKSKKILFKNP